MKIVRGDIQALRVDDDTRSAMTQQMEAERRRRAWIVSDLELTDAELQTLLGGMMLEGKAQEYA